MRGGLTITFSFYLFYYVIKHLKFKIIIIKYIIFLMFNAKLIKKIIISTLYNTHTNNLISYYASWFQIFEYLKDIIND